MGRNRKSDEDEVDTFIKSGNYFGKAFAFFILFLVLAGVSEFLGLPTIVKLASWIITLVPAAIFFCIFLYHFVKSLLFPAE